MPILGIDPGANGGVGELWHMGEPPKAHAFSGKTLYDLWCLFNSFGQSSFPAKAYLEQVHAMPGQGVTSMFNFGRSYGHLEAMLTASGIPFERVTPSKWQKEFGLYKQKGETNTQKKNRHKALAQELFPNIKITHAIADALLIAEYGRRQQ